VFHSASVTGRLKDHFVAICWKSPAEVGPEGHCLDDSCDFRNYAKHGRPTNLLPWPNVARLQFESARRRRLPACRELRDWTIASRAWRWTSFPPQPYDTNDSSRDEQNNQGSGHTQAPTLAFHLQVCKVPSRVNGQDRPHQTRHDEVKQKSALGHSGQIAC